LATGAVIDAPFLNGIGDALKSHVRFEEEELFPFAETTLLETDLDYIAQMLDG